MQKLGLDNSPRRPRRPPTGAGWPGRSFSELKTNLKKFDAALVSGDKAAADAAYKTAVKAVDQAVNKGLLHKNNAARKKSSMTLKLNKLA